MRYFATGIVAAALAVGPFSFIGAAQEQSTTQQQDQVQARIAEFKERLKLTPEQEEKVVPIFRQQMERAKEIRDKNQGDRRAMMKEMRNAQEDMDKQLAEVLDKDQMSELKKIRSERRDQMRENMRRRRNQQ